MEIRIFKFSNGVATWICLKICYLTGRIGQACVSETWEKINNIGEKRKKDKNVGELK